MVRLHVSAERLHAVGHAANSVYWPCHYLGADGNNRSDACGLCCLSRHIGLCYLVLFFLTSQMAQALGMYLGLDSDNDGDVDFLDLLHWMASTRVGRFLGMPVLYKMLNRLSCDPFHEIHKRLDRIIERIAELSPYNSPTHQKPTSQTSNNSPINHKSTSQTSNISPTKHKSTSQALKSV